jgi:hypothetical protein
VTASIIMNVSFAPIKCRVCLFGGVRRDGKCRVLVMLRDRGYAWRDERWDDLLLLL